MTLWPRSLFARTAVLIASTLLVFSLIAWQAIVWIVVVPAGELTVHLLTQRAHDALEARRKGASLPADARFETTVPQGQFLRFRGFSYGVYVENIRQGLQTALGAPEVRISRLAVPSEVWVRLPEQGQVWLVMSWRLAGPTAPLAALVVLAAGALIVLGGAAISARRLTAPLAVLAAAAARVAEGQKVHIETLSGPSEVRSLAGAFQSMSFRLAELDEKRELMLGGISHDLRTPLARIRVAVELLEVADAALIDEMTASVDEMDRMIGQFLHYVRANYRETPTLTSLDGLAREALAMYISDSGLTLELRAPAPRCFAAECARHTLLNLVQNAFEYGRTPVIVRTSCSPTHVELTVSDQGRGLTPEEWAAAVRPFHRLRSQPGSGHTGLGLALVDRLIFMSGGTLQAEQRASGFTVSVRLPISPDLSLVRAPASLRASVTP